LPTPNTYDYNTTQDEESKQRTLERRAEEGKTCYPSRFNALRQLAREDRLPYPDMLPTPTAIEGVKWTNTWNPNSQMGQSLSAMAGSGMLPTPICSDGEAGGCAAIRKDTGKQRMDCLRHFVACITTELDENGNPKYAERDGGASRLSPLFTEEMMGFPLMWTALPFLSENGEPKPSKPTATPSVRR
jgi:hypothetical protein